MNSLTHEQLKKGQKHFLDFCSYNGLSTALLADSTLILFMLKMGFSAYVVAIVSSFGFLGTIFMALGKYFVSYMGGPRSVSVTWYFRNLFGLFTVLAPLLIIYASFEAGLFIVITGALGFYIFRGIGSLAITPIAGELVQGQDASKFNSDSSLRFNIGYFIALLLLIVTLEFSDSTMTYQSLIALGGIIGCISGYKASRIPELTNIREAATLSFKDSFVFSFKDDNVRKLLIIQTIYFIAISLIGPYAILAIKGIYKIADSWTLVFVLLQFAGGIMISYLSAKLVQKIGYKNIMLSSYALQIIVGAMWILAPSGFNFVFCVILFIVLGMSQMGGFLSLSNYFLDVTPSQKMLGVTIVLSVISCFAAGLFGSIVAASYLGILENRFTSPSALYRIFFSTMTILILFGFYAVLRMEKINYLSFSRLFVRTK